MSGVIGIYSHELVGPSLFFGLNSLQHRGQESAGITVSNGTELIRHRGMGLVMDVFDEKVINELQGTIGIGHVKYSTAGLAQEYNSQPIMAFAGDQMLSMAHNGDLINYQILRTRLEEEGMMFQTTDDAEVILYLITRYYVKGMNIIDAIKKTMTLIEGAYAITLLKKDMVIGFRDLHGIRPLVLGRDGKDFILASENAAIEIIGGEVIRDVKPGEIVYIDKDGIHSTVVGKDNQRKSCIFEYVYFSRNDATLNHINSYMFRRRTGEILWKESPVDVDLVIPVPDSGIPSAIGYSQESGIPLAQGLVKNRYMGRTFIRPTQKERDMAVNLKLNPLSHVVKDKNIVLIDDSIVRGTTSRNLIKRMRQAGAKEVHLRVTSPPVRYPCYYGIDTPSKRDLIAANYSIKEIEEKIGADSLDFISLEGLGKATKRGINNFCTACFTGDYPVDPTVL